MTHADAAAQLNVLAEEFWDGYLAASPMWATVIGDRRFDDRIDDVSPEASSRLVTWLRDVAARASAIQEADLDERGRVTREMLIDEATSHAASVATGMEDWTVDPLQGPIFRLIDLADFQTLRSSDDGDAMVERWHGIGRYLDQIGENHRRALDAGFVAVRPAVERLVDILDGVLSQPLDDWKLGAPATASLEGWPADRAERFRSAIRDAVSEVAAPAMERYRTLLRQTILPAARDVDHPGVMHVPGGDHIYRTFIRAHTTLDLSAEEIHETGLREIDRIDREFVELGRRLLGTTDLASTLARLRGDPALRFATKDEVFETARRSLERATANLGGWFGRIPAAACVVVPIPSESEVHQTIAYYSWPALDGSRPGRYYINLHAPETRPRYEAEALAFHESVPGHHLQIAVAQELPDLPAFQRMLGSTAYAEGWGLYTERLSDEMGLYSSDMDRFGILSFDAWRAGRLVVDTGMHALGWTRQQAIDFLVEHSALGENNIVNEVDRYIVWPGQALAYKIGQLEILRLRDQARSRLGDAFDIADFHDTVLGSGAVSLPVLRGIVDRWLDRASPSRT